MVRYKRMFFLPVIVLCCILLVPAAFANPEKVADRAGLLTGEEQQSLQQKLSNLAEKWNMDFVFATVPTIAGADVQTAAEDFYDYNGYGIGPDWAGVILFINIGERDVNVTAEGHAQDAFTSYALDMVREEVTPYLSDGEFYEAADYFADLADLVFQAEADGNPYDYDHTYKKPMSLLMRLLISGGSGLVLAVIVFLILWAQLTSVKTASEAGNYIKPGSFHLTRSNDLFLYKNVTRQKIESDSGSKGGGSHTTSSGHSASGSSGKF